MNMMVINKNNNKEYEIFDITYNNVGYPHFLIYKDSQWIRMSAKHFKPITEEYEEHCEVVEYLLDMLEEEHIGMRAEAIKEVKDKFGIEL